MSRSRRTKINHTIQVRVDARSDRFMAGAITAVLLLLYLGTRSQVHNQCVDCTEYANRIQRGELKDLFQGGHLIYLWLLERIYRAVSSIFPEASVFTTAQTFNSLMSSMAVGVFYRVARTVIRDRWLSVVFSLILASSYHFWLFAIDVEVHAPAIFLCFLTLHLALHTPIHAPIWNFVGLGLLTAAAALFHVFGGVVVLPVLGLMLVKADHQAKVPVRLDTRHMRAIFVYGLTCAVLVLAAYLVVTIRALHLRNAGEIASWVLAFRSDVGYADRSALPIDLTLALSAGAIVRALLGAVTWLAVPGLRELLLGVFAERCMSEELYIVRNLGPVTASALTSLSAAAAGLLAVFMLVSARRFAVAVRRISRAAVGLAIWLVAYGVLIMYLDPGSYEHWGIYWMPILILVGGAGLAQVASDEPGKKALVRGASLALVIALFLGNIGNVLLLTSAENDLYVHRLEWYRANTNSQDIVISSGGYKWTSYTSLYLQARVVRLDSPSRTVSYLNFRRSLAEEISQTRAEGGRIFVMQDTLAPELCQARYGDWDLSFYEAFRRDMLPRLECSQLDDVSICQLEG